MKDFLDGVAQLITSPTKLFRALVGFILTLSVILAAASGAYRNPYMKDSLYKYIAGVFFFVGDTKQLGGDLAPGAQEGYFASTGENLFPASVVTPTVSALVPTQAGQTVQVPVVETPIAELLPKPGSIESHVALQYLFGLQPGAAPDTYALSSDGADVNKALEQARLAVSNYPKDLLGIWVLEQATALKPMVDELHGPVTPENATRLKQVAEEVLKVNPRVHIAYEVLFWVKVLNISGRTPTGEELLYLYGLKVQTGRFTGNAPERSDGATLEVQVSWPDNTRQFQPVVVLLTAKDLNFLLGQRPLEGEPEKRLEEIQANMSGWMEEGPATIVKGGPPEVIPPNLPPSPNQPPANIAPPRNQSIACQTYGLHICNKTRSYQ